MKIIKVKSKTKPNKEYEVRVFDDGTMVCSCPRHSWNRIRGIEEDCKHIKEVKKHEKKHA